MDEACVLVIICAWRTVEVSSCAARFELLLLLLLRELLQHGCNHRPKPTPGFGYNFASGQRYMVSVFMSSLPVRVWAQPVDLPDHYLERICAL